jgi:hypothetical protein
MGEGNGEGSERERLDEGRRAISLSAISAGCLTLGRRAWLCTAAKLDQLCEGVIAT